MHVRTEDCPITFAALGLVALILITLIAPRAAAQAFLEADINTGDGDSFPTEFQVYNGTLYFQAEDGTNGAEFWAFDGANATMVADIAPGSFDSSPADPVVYDGKLYFQASDAAFTYGRELWVYDSATQSVTNAVDIATGTSSASPAHLAVYDDLLHFAAFEPGRGTELWESEGATATRLTDLNDGAAGSDPVYLTVFNNTLYFSASDGTNGRELWAYDGTSASLAANINTGGASSSPQHLVVYDGALYFVANSDAQGRELWRFDGTSASLAADITPGADSSFPAFQSGATENALVVYDGKLYFPATTPSTGDELFVYDGSTASVAADISSGSGGSAPKHLTVYNGKLYFSASGDESGGRELWVYDGTDASVAAEINPTSIGSDPRHLTVYTGRVYFQADDGTAGVELWSFEDSTPIPVELMSFDAVRDERAVQLTWQTASETNNAGFEIEHASGLTRPFESVAFVAGRGTTTQPHTYSYRLTGLSEGRHRLRLKQIDLDGTFAHSPEVEILIPMTAPLALHPAYPNPFTDQTTLRVAANRSGAARLVLYNALGQAVQVLFDGVVSPGTPLTARVDGSNLPSGVYFARLTGAGAPLVQPLVLQK